ncbi:Uncharacterised protein [Shigella sonnei]|nr:Uncharacterised protein [Shigella sonnei]
MIATFWRETPDAISRPACAHYSGESLGRRPPIRPYARAASSPAFVRSTISSRSISARAPITWKKKRPIGVLVSIESVRLRKLMPRSRNSSTSTTRCRILRPSRSSFQTTSVSPADNVLSSFFSPGLSDFVPLILSSKISSHPAQFNALRCRSVFWSFVDTRT